MLASLALPAGIAVAVLKYRLYEIDLAVNRALVYGVMTVGVVGSYVGVPVVSDQPKFFGTLCHFDYDRHEVSDEEFLFLERVARLLPRFLPA